MNVLEKVWEIYDFQYLPLPYRLDFKVEPRHIKEGEQGCPQNCPIAHAVSEYLQVPSVLVWVGSEGITISRDDMATGTAYACVDQSQFSFTWDFDGSKGKKTEPCNLRHVMSEYQSRDPIWKKHTPAPRWDERWDEDV